MVGSYYDESQVDGSGTVAAIGGVIVKHGNAHWMEREWHKVLARYPRLPKGKSGKPYVHTKDFGNHEILADFPIDEKRTLFSSLSALVNQFKEYSVESTLTPDEYRNNLASWEANERLTIHVMCFIQAATIQARIAEARSYRYPIPYMLDRGCPSAADIEIAHNFLAGNYPELGQPGGDFHIGRLTWEDDREFPCLQAADIVAWAVRRRRSGKSFESVGCEALEAILAERHVSSHLDNELIAEFADDMRSRMK